MYKEVSGISTPSDKDTLWRYISFEKFVNMLDTESLFFTRAYKYEDPFEGYIHKVTRDSCHNLIDEINFDRGHPTDGVKKLELEAIVTEDEIQKKYIMCNCWHTNNDESMAMWEKYHLRNNGIAIKTTMEKLKNSITDAIDVYIGNVEYISREKFQHEYVNQYLNPIILKGHSILYHPYFFKRKVFEYEQEVRVIIDIDTITDNIFKKLNPDDFLEPNVLLEEFPDIDNQGRRYNVDVNALVDEVIISPYVEDWIVDTVRSASQQYGFNFDVHKSTIL